MSLIMIDPGHGGQDAGAVANGFQEKDLNLLIAIKLRDLLSKNKIGAEMTRSGDAFKSLKERCEIANNSKAGLFLSVHCNGSENADAQGIEVFHLPASKQGRKFAGLLYEELCNLSRQGRGVKPADFYVLKYSIMPACLAECGFITNREEAAWLKNHIEEIAQALAQGIMNYLARFPGEAT